MTSNAKNFAQVFKTSFRRKTCEEKITSSQRLDSTTGIKRKSNFGRKMSSETLCIQVEGYNDGII